MASNWTDWSGGDAMACARAGAQAKNISDQTAPYRQIKPPQRTLRRSTATRETMETPRVTGPVARHRELRCPAHPRMLGCPPPIHPDRQRSRMTTADGRSPGSRVFTFRLLPGTRDPSGCHYGRFAAYSCGGSRSVERSLVRTAFPFDPRREPSPSTVLGGTVTVNRCRNDRLQCRKPVGERRRTRLQDQRRFDFVQRAAAHRRNAFEPGPEGDILRPEFLAAP